MDIESHKALISYEGQLPQPTHYLRNGTGHTVTQLSQADSYPDPNVLGRTAYLDNSGRDGEETVESYSNPCDSNRIVGLKAARKSDTVRRQGRVANNSDGCNASEDPGSPYSKVADREPDTEEK